MAKLMRMEAQRYIAAAFMDCSGIFLQHLTDGRLGHLPMASGIPGIAVPTAASAPIMVMIAGENFFIWKFPIL